MHIYEYIQHPCTTLHLTGPAPKPVKVNDGRVGLNGRIGLLITALVGTMIGAVIPGDVSAAGVVGASGGSAVAPGTAGA
jgi:hypothetical protein